MSISSGLPVRENVLKLLPEIHAVQLQYCYTDAHISLPCAQEMHHFKALQAKIASLEARCSAPDCIVVLVTAPWCLQLHRGAYNCTVVLATAPWCLQLHRGACDCTVVLATAPCNFIVVHQGVFFKYCLARNFHGRKFSRIA